MLKVIRTKKDAEKFFYNLKKYYRKETFEIAFENLYQPAINFKEVTTNYYFKFKNYTLDHSGYTCLLLQKYGWCCCPL